MSKITYGLTCDFCDQYFTAEREHARFCSDAHRVAWHRARAQRMNSGVELADARRIPPSHIARALVDADRAARSARSTQPKPRSRPRAQSVGRGDYAEMLRVFGMDDAQRSEDLWPRFAAASELIKTTPAAGSTASLPGSGRRTAPSCSPLGIGARTRRRRAWPRPSLRCAMSRSSRPSSRM